MRLRISWILCGAALVVSGSMGMAACGSSGGTGPDGGTGGSSGSGGTKGSGSGGTTGSGSGGTTGSGSGGSSGSGTGGTAGTSGDAGCGKAGKVFAETPDGGMYCPFSGVDGGKTEYWKAPSQVCCVAKFDEDSGTSLPSVCVDSTTILPDGGGCSTGPGSILFECEGPLDCAGSVGGAVCCGSGMVTNSNPACSVDAGFGYVSGAAGKGTSCAASCAAGQTVVCAVQADCTGGTICTPTDLHGNHIGYCL